MQWVSSVVILFDMCLSVRVRDCCCFCCCCCDEYRANHWCCEDFIVSLLTSHGRRNNMLKPWIKFNWSEKAAKKNWQKKTEQPCSMKYRRQDNGNNHCTFSLFNPLCLSLALVRIFWTLALTLPKSICDVCWVLWMLVFVFCILYLHLMSSSVAVDASFVCKGLN